MITLTCPHGLKIEDDSDPRSPAYQQEWLRALLFTCPACSFNGEGYIEPVAVRALLAEVPVGAPFDEPEAEDEPEPEVAEEKPRRVREAVGDDGLTDTQRAILTFIRGRGEVDTHMIRTEVPSATEDKLKRAMRLFRDRRLVESHGPPNATTYKPTGVARSMNTPTVPEEEPAGDGYTLAGVAADQRAVRLNGPGTDEGRLLESVRFKPCWSIGQHASRLDLHPDKVAVAMRKLEAEGEVRASEKAGRVVWKIT